MLQLASDVFSLMDISDVISFLCKLLLVCVSFEFCICVCIFVCVFLMLFNVYFVYYSLY